MEKTLYKQNKRNQYLKIRSDHIIYVEKKILSQVNDYLLSLIQNGVLKGYLGLYWPLKGEIDLRALKNSLKVPTALPASKKNGAMNYRPWLNTALKKDENQILAPLSEPYLIPEDISVLLAPAIAIDIKGIRLGYGGGYFDRLRANKAWRSIPAIAVLPQACVSEGLFEKDNWDIPFDGWITEKGFTQCINPNKSLNPHKRD